jgi:hypothetical protein
MQTIYSPNLIDLLIAGSRRAGIQKSNRIKIIHRFFALIDECSFLKKHVSSLLPEFLYTSVDNTKGGVCTLNNKKKPQRLLGFLLPP